MKRRSTMFHLRFLIIFSTVLLHSGTAFDDNNYQQLNNKQSQNGSLLITTLLNINHNKRANDESSSESTSQHVNIVRINQSLEVTSDRILQENDQSYNSRSKSKPKYVNKSANSADKKNAILLKKSLSVSQTQAAMDGNWKCPNITDNRSLECGCDMPLTLRCNGDVHGLALIADGLRNSSSVVSILDCTLRNVTVLNEARIFENVSLSGLFISSGEIKRVHRNAFLGIKTPLQILGLPNNALNSVPSTSLQYLTSLDRLDLSNNHIKLLSSTDFLSLQKLTYLEISENQISSISQKTFVPLKNLVTLKLNGNKLGVSPGSLKTIAECINLKDLDLRSNLIKGPLMADILPTIKSLENLNLEKNSFSSIHGHTFKDFNNLISLILNHNQIDVLQDDAFIGLSSLQKLDLSFNGIVAVSEGSLKHMNRLILLDFTHNFLRAITADIISPLPQLKELKLDGNDISIVEKNAMASAAKLKILSLRDNPLACDCKLQYFTDWINNESQLSSKDLMAFCKTPPYLEGAQLSQLKSDSLTCSETGHLEMDNEKIMRQVNTMFKDLSDNFTMTNSSSNIKFVDYNYTLANVLNLNWILHLNKTIDFHSLVIFEGSDIKIRMEKSNINHRSMVRDMDEYFLVSVPASTNLDLDMPHEFCLIFSEDNFHFFLGCSNSLILEAHSLTVDLNSRILQSSIQDSDISSFENVADKKNNPLYMNDDMVGDHGRYPSTTKTVKKSNPVMVQDDSIEVYPSREYYYNSIWPNLSLSILIILMSVSIVYILWSKYQHYYKHHQPDSISPSYSEDSINTQIEDENDNTTNKYVKLEQATTAL